MPEPEIASCASVDAVIATGLLDERPARPPEHARENQALLALAQALASPSTEGIAQQLVEQALRLCDADSAGLSLAAQDKGEDVFRWIATAGTYAKYLHGTMPRFFSPCGEVLARGEPLVMRSPDRFYPYAAQLDPPVREVLLVPFESGGRLVGTIWVICHDDRKGFDREDLRLVRSLAVFASAISATVGLVQDLQAQRSALHAADRRKDEFIAKVSHELRNPLAPIGTAVHVLKRQPAAQEPVQAKMLGVIERQVGALTALVDDLLDISRVRSGKLAMRPQRVDLRQVLAGALEMCRPQLDAAGHRLELDAGGGPVWIDGDPRRLAQVICNLVNNAAKYTPGGGRVEVSLCVEGGDALLRVADNGIGLLPELLERIFDLYEQAPEAQAQPQTEGGLGIGLALVKQIVGLHGGTCKAESAGPGHGSAFSVRLPLAQAD